MEVVMHVDLSGCWLGKLKKKFPVDVMLLDTIPLHEGEQGVQDLVDINLNGQNIDEIVNHIRKMDGVAFVSRSTNEGTKIKLIVGTSSCLGCRVLADSRAFLLSANVLEGGWVEWRVIHENMEAIESLKQDLEKAGMSPKVKEVKTYKDRNSLDNDQELVLKIALDMGYFDFPKKAGIRELARRLKVSTAYISYKLRSAQKNTIEMYFRR